MAGKTVVIENISKRLWIVGHLQISPTQAIEVPEAVAKDASVVNAIEAGELRIAEEVKDAQIIRTEEEAEKVKREQKRGAKK